MDTETDIYTVWELAHMADVSSPDSAESEGAKWLESVREDALALFADNEGESLEDLLDKASEYADQAVPIYTHNRFEVLVDLAAYDEEINDFGQPEDMVQAAGWSLYMVAERLIRAIVEDKVSDRDLAEDEDEDETDALDQ
ncbi:MAG TPA: hypothetical protein VJ837_06145 [Candidatus Paceibacterota bacterium]|nr:hypothetical protein [Candidatus Paceibacterota bacterium]